MASLLNDIQPSELIWYLFGLLFIIAIIILATRWLFKVNKTEAYQKASLDILKEIASKNGVDKGELDKILKKYSESKS